MTRKLLSLTAAAAVAVAAPASATVAADAPAVPLKVTGAYLFIDHEKASQQDFVRVVFRTASPLPRRFDGLIRAGAKIDGVGHSLGTAKRGSTCYTAASEIKGGSVPSIGADGQVRRKGAKAGRSFKVVIETQDGQKVQRTLKLRTARKGDASGKPLGC
jgi:hypothetical protein